jgi:hypothetical protein
VKERPNEKFVFNETDRPTTKYGRESSKFWLNISIYIFIYFSRLITFHNNIKYLFK